MVDFSTFKVEVLPALERDDKKFIVPNSGHGEDWIIFDPKSEIDGFEKSNDKTDQLTRNLIKIIKKWKTETTNVDIKTYIIDGYIIEFLNNYYFENYPKVVSDFFKYLHEIENKTYTETSKKSAQKAHDFYKEGKEDKAIEKYKKIFGDNFPKSLNQSLPKQDNYTKAPNEEFIEELCDVSIDENIHIQIEIECKPKRGWTKSVLLSKISPHWLRKEDEVFFNVAANNLSGEYVTKWKVRNFGEEAEKNNSLRGGIEEDNNGLHKYKDKAKFFGEHFLECYIIQNGICVARKKVNVTI